MQFLRFDSIPNVDEAKNDATFVAHVELFHNQWLIKDLWSIVCLFLFNWESTYILSIPLGTIVCSCDDDDEKHVKLDDVGEICITHFYGAEDGEEFEVSIAHGESEMVSGHFRYPCEASYGREVSFTHTFVEENKARRFLVEFTLNYTSPDQLPSGHWLIWDKKLAKLFPHFTDIPNEIVESGVSVFRM